MKKFSILIITFLAYSCAEPAANNEPQSTFYFSCTPIGWTRDTVEDREPTEYQNALDYPSYSLDSPPLWLEKEGLAIDFSEEYFDGKNFEGNYFNTTIFGFGSNIIYKTTEWCGSKSPLGSCTTYSSRFNRITHQLLKTDIDAPNLEGERSLYECKEVNRLGEDYQQWRKNLEEQAAPFNPTYHLNQPQRSK